MRRRIHQQQYQAHSNFAWQQQQPSQHFLGPNNSNNNNVFAIPAVPNYTSTPRSNNRALSHSASCNSNGSGSNSLNNNYVNGGLSMGNSATLHGINNVNNNNNNCVLSLSSANSNAVLTNYHHPTASPQASPLPHRNAFLQ